MNEIKKSYEKIHMSRDARERIYTEIMDCQENGSREEDDGRRNVFSGWRAVVAACLGLALLIPSGVYAAGKISDYLTVTIGQEKYQAKVRIKKSDGKQNMVLSDIDQSQSEESGKEDAENAGKQSAKPEKYIKVTADFGKEYQYQDQSYDYYVDENGKEEKVKRQLPEGTDGMYEYSHRDGFDAAKDIYYDVIYMDVGEEAILNLYDKASIKETTVNGHKALLCQSNTVHKSRYASDYDKKYTLDIYVFYEEYGYVINLCGMQGLGQERLISLAESISVAEAEKEQASRYEYLSRLQRADLQKNQENDKKIEIPSVKGLNQKVDYRGLSCQVTDVAVSSKVTDRDLKKFNENYFSGKSGYWDEKGKLKPYIREEIRRGDGASQPEASVVGTEKVQPKMVYVTIKVKANRTTFFELPMVRFLEKENGRYYDNQNQRYWQYNRPEKIRHALVDFMPCYFKETEGGKNFWLKEMEKGEEQVYHFAYMVDGDLTDDMVLLFNTSGSKDEIKYVDIWK
ncbi:MAG: hypothetical protein HFH62_08860 [Lachnospiraceae bacterium]|nr:hypothetical protein [Lachnospiraceae bacterium]